MLRGKIYNSERARQLRDFSGLRFGNITPTDIDGMIEYKNIGYIIIELKYDDNELPHGQQLALERLTDDLERAGKKTLCIVATHDTTNPEDYIDVANAIVTSCRYKRVWQQGSGYKTVRELIAWFISKIE